MTKYNDIERYAGYKNLDSLTKEAFLPGMGGGTADAMNMFSGGAGNPMSGLMGGMVPGMGGGASAEGVASSIGGGMLSSIISDPTFLMLVAPWVAKKGWATAQGAINFLKGNPAKLAEAVADMASPTNANLSEVQKLTQYMASKGTTVAEAAKSIPGTLRTLATKVAPGAAEVAGKVAPGAVEGIAGTLTKAAPGAIGAAETGAGAAVKGLGGAAKSLASKGIGKGIGMGLKGLGMAGKVLSGPAGWAYLGLQGVNWLLGNDSKQWMTKAVDTLADKGQIDPKEKSSFLNVLMESFTKGVEALMAEEEAKKQTAALITNREKQAAYFSSTLRSKEASFTVLRLQKEEQQILENLEVLKQANMVTSILGIDNIITQVGDLIKSPDVLELVTRAVKESKLPEDKHQALIQTIMSTVETGLQAYKSQIESQKKEQTPQQTNQPTDKTVNNTTNNTATPTGTPDVKTQVQQSVNAPVGTTTVQPVQAGSVMVGSTPMPVFKAPDGTIQDVSGNTYSQDQLIKG